MAGGSLIWMLTRKWEHVLPSYSAPLERFPLLLRFCTPWQCSRIGSQRVFKLEDHGGSLMSPLPALQVKELKHKPKVTSLNLLLASERLCQVSKCHSPGYHKLMTLFLSSKHQETSPLAACGGLGSQMSTFPHLFWNPTEKRQKGFPFMKHWGLSGLLHFLLVCRCIHWVGNVLFNNIYIYTFFPVSSFYLGRGLGIERRSYVSISFVVGIKIAKGGTYEAESSKELLI